MSPRQLHVLPRRLQRYLVEVSLITIAVLLIGMVRHWLGHGHVSLVERSEEESEFYHFHELPPLVVKSPGDEWKDLTEDGRKRTLNTSEGLVVVKDMLLVPKNPLPYGANLYKSIESLDDGLDSVDLLPIGSDNSEDLVNRGPNRRTERLSRHQNSNCAVLPCIEFLSDQDILHFQHCSKAAIFGGEPPANQSCSFRQPNPSLQLVALASSPGSGVEGLRWLLQELTGFCTGSVQCNPRLRRAGFVGESISTTAVLGIATDKIPSWRDDSVGETVAKSVPAFDSAVYILRNPFDAILQAWTEQQHQHIELNWDSFVCEQALTWQQTLNSWLVDGTNHSIMVIRYEELETRTKRELLKIMKFLNTPYSVTKLVGLQWIGSEEAKNTYSFEAHHVDCVNAAIRKSAEMLTSHRRIDVLVYERTREPPS